MLIDFGLLLLLVLAIFKGMKQGLIVAAFSFIALFLGLAAALKMSALVARWLSESVHIQASWLPFFSFILIMVAVGIAVKMVAKIIETLLSFSMLGWLNTVGGILLFCCIYVTLYSVFIFYLQQMHLLKPATIAASKTYQYIYFWGPEAITFFSTFIPVLKGIFEELSTFFGRLSKNLS